LERFFVNVSLRDSNNVEVLKMQQGDSGLTWIKELFDKVDRDALSEIKSSEPGSFRGDYPILLPEGNGNLIVEVLVKDER